MYIEYAIDALVVAKHGAMYISRKDRVNAMNWNIWRQVVGADGFCHGDTFPSSCNAPNGNSTNVDVRLLSDGGYDTPSDYSIATALVNLARDWRRSIS